MPATVPFQSSARLGSLAAATLLLSLSACTSSLDLAPDSLPRPVIAVGNPVAACAAGGSTVIVLDDVGTVLQQNFPAGLPLNRLTVTGTVTGLGAGEGVIVLLMPDASACPLQGAVAATVVGNTFTAVVNLGTRTRMQVVALATSAAPADITCDVASNCLAATGAALSGLSNTLLIRLD